MRHKYETRGIVLARVHTGEATTLVTLLTADLGLVQARAQSLRKSGAKLSPSLATFAESSVVLVRGREGWRLSGAVLEENWFARLQEAGEVPRAARVSTLLLRLVAGEAHDTLLFPIVQGFFRALAESPKELCEAVEMLAGLRALAALGLDSGTIPGESTFAPPLLAEVAEGRAEFITRINRGITASGL